ncbi:MAG: hypothetical protein ABR985_18500 [Methanotrichaceae archaeon]
MVTVELTQRPETLGSCSFPDLALVPGEPGDGSSTTSYFSATLMWYYTNFGTIILVNRAIRSRF